MTFPRIRGRALGAVLTAIAAAAIAVPAAADNTVTQIVAAGTRSASVTDLALGTVGYSHSAQTSTGTLTLTADDSTGSNLGWNITVQSSAFVYSGDNGGTDIPAANFSLTSAAAPTVNAGQAISALGGPKVPTVSPIGTLDTPRKTLQASVLFGNGNYSQQLGVSLNIPAQSAAGTYTGTLTTTISAAP